MLFLCSGSPDNWSGYRPTRSELKRVSTYSKEPQMHGLMHSIGACPCLLRWIGTLDRRPNLPVASKHGDCPASLRIVYGGGSAGRPPLLILAECGLMVAFPCPSMNKVD